MHRSSASSAGIVAGASVASEPPAPPSARRASTDGADGAADEGGGAPEGDARGGGKRQRHRLDVVHQPRKGVAVEQAMALGALHPPEELGSGGAHEHLVSPSTPITLASSPVTLWRK